MAAALERIAERPKAYVIDLCAVPILDSTGAATLAAFCRKSQRRGAPVAIVTRSLDLQAALGSQHLRPPVVDYFGSLNDAIASIEARLATFRKGGA